MLKYFLIFCFSFNCFGSFGAVNLWAQTAETELTPLDFSDETIKKFKQDPDFDYTEAVAEDNWWSKFKRYIRLQWGRFLDWLFGDYEAPLLLAILLDILPYLLLGLLLVFLLYLFAKISPGNYLFGTSSTPEVSFDEEEKIIRTRDIKKLIEKAVAKENYRLAVRYHFLYVLQQLSRQELVIYDSAKTDEEYVQEIQDPELKIQFKKVNRIYDFVWYGNFATTAENYRKITKGFEKVELLIQPQHEQSL